jgi:hypothetical protein
MRKVYNCQTKSIDELPDLPSPPPKTPEEIDAEKEQQAIGTIEQAFALVVLEEVNLLRQALGLEPRTVQQLKNAVKAKL